MLLSSLMRSRHDEREFTPHAPWYMIYAHRAHNTYSRTGHECPSRHVFLSHTSRTSWVINHIPIERGVSCGGNQVLFINFGVRTQKIRRAYLNGQIVSEFVSGCLNFKYVSENDVGIPNHYCRPHNSSWIKSYDLSKTPLSISPILGSLLNRF